MADLLWSQASWQMTPLQGAPLPCTPPSRQPHPQSRALTGQGDPYQLHQTILFPKQRSGRKEKEGLFESLSALMDG
jgi:hypothetical protein